MSAEQTQHAPVRLLIAESSENTAQEFDSLLRDAGIATRTQLIDLSTAGEALPTADLMLCNAELPELERLLPSLKTRAPHVPIILVSSPETDISTSRGLQLGAADVVSRQEPDELVLVFKRELEHVCRGQRMNQLHKALAEAEQRCQLLLQSAQAAIAYVHEGMHIYANEGYLKLFGFTDADELLGLPLMDLMAGEGSDAVKSELKRFRQSGQQHTFDFHGQATNGTQVDGTMTLAAAEYEGEPCTQVTVRARPPAELPAPEQAEPAQPEPAASAPSEQMPADGGSGVSTFLDSAENILDSVQPHRVIAVAQIDKFAQLQETYGLRNAELVSAQVHRELQERLGERACARLSHHQFAFAITDADRAAVTERANKLRQAMEALMLEASERTVRVTVSIGGAELDTESEDEPGTVLERALNAAFATVLRSEQDGGNRVEILSREVAREEPNSEAGKILALINDAIDNHRFVLLFQPIISLRGDTDEHYEVFLRMQDRDGSQMVPDQFLRTAIQHGVAGKIDRWVVLQSIKMLSTHRAKGHDTRLTINLTANSITDPDFVQWLGVAIKAARLPTDAVIFQITEEDAGGLIRQAKAFVDGLHGLHARVSLSRFGLTDNPFELLSHLPVDFVKLDGARIESMLRESGQKEEVAGIIQALQSTGKLTIIPMVESATALSALWQAGANYIQGHYLQEPSTEMNYDFSTDD